MAQKHQLTVGEDGFGHVNHDVPGARPWQENRRLGPAHRSHRAFQESGPRVAAARIRRKREPLRLCCRGHWLVQPRHQRRLGGCEAVLAHVAAPIRQILARGFHFGRQRQHAILGRPIPGIEQRVGRWHGGQIRRHVAQRERGEAFLLQMLQVTPERLRWRVYPRVRHVRYAMKPQHRDTALAGLGNHLEKVLERPVWIRIAGSGDQQRMMAKRVIGRAHHGPAVLHFRSSAAPRQRYAAAPEHRDRFRAERIAAPGETRGLRHFHPAQFVVHQRQFRLQARRAAGSGKVRVRPRVIAGLESHRVQFGDLLPRHEIRAVRHPAVRDEERGVESQLLQQRPHERAV